MNIASFSVKRPVFTTMLTLGLVVLGAYSYNLLSVELFPNTDFPFVLVTTIYPGAGPEEVETQLTQKIEDEVSTLADIDLLESISREGVSLVVMRFRLEASGDEAANDVRAKVDGILNDLPNGAEKPVVEKFEVGAAPIISLAVTSDLGVNATYKVVDETMRDRLSQVSGVATIDIFGGQEREIRVEVDRRKLERYEISIGTVTALIAAENVNIPGGRVIERDREYTIRTLGEFESVDEIGRIRIPLAAGGTIRLGEIARIRDTYEEARSVARFRSSPAVQVDVIKRSGANTIGAALGVYDAVRDLRAELPPGFVIEYASDDSRFIQESVRDVTTNILIGILLTALLLWVFLRNVRATLIVAVVMPATIISTFLLMQIAGFSLNVVSLLALGVSVGILVTNAIVVLENVIRHLRKGKDPKQAAVDGTNQVALAVLASVATNVVVFVPIAFMQGIIGRIFIQFGLTVVFATFFSLLISFTLTPMLCAFFLKRTGRMDAGEAGEEDHGGDAGAAAVNGTHYLDRRISRLSVSYRSLLDWSLRRVRNRVILSVAALLFLALSFFLLGISGGEFMPEMDQGYMNVEIELPAGSSLEKTEEIVAEAEEIIRALPEVVSVISTIGGSDRGVDEAILKAKLADKSDRDRMVDELVNALRPLLAGLPGAEVVVAGSASETGRVESDAEIEVMGDETDKLRMYAERVRKIVAAAPGAVDVKSSWREGGEELLFIPDREEIARRGLTTGRIAMFLRNSFEGNDEAVFRERGEEYAIRVHFDEETRNDPATLEEIRIPTGGGEVPLVQLGRIERRTGQAEILHRDRQKRITISANLAEGTISDLVRTTRPQFEAMNLPPGYKIVFGGMYEFQEESFSALFSAMILAIVLTYVVLAMILESFAHPITVMLTLPLGLVGASFGIFFGGQSINIFSLMAMVMLIGIVVNNAILLIDYVKQLRGRGLGLHEAILEGCPVRLRAVIMTNLATAIGMIPQALGTGQGSEIRVAMALTTIGGVLVSALFTLILIPSLYAAFEELIARARKRV
ncbi:MAG: efflux RND transporter permease subunit [Candidatus Eisenbacteria bacterium]|nr:efflux RND transporter permease subunit [Candidatus Eisenbacteria bacterium]